MHRQYMVEARRKKGISISEISTNANVSMSYYSQIEHGDRGTRLPVRTFINIIDTLDINPTTAIDKEREYINKYYDD